jgi:8-oxo-dGTP pyrophosphatase MutT (NUDIX family)
VTDLEGALAARHPDNFPKHSLMIAAAAVIVEDGRLLLVCDTHGFWSGVGGWVDAGERPDEAVLRELREELGVEGEVTGVLHPYLEWHAYRASDDRGFLLFIYRVSLKSREFTLLESEITDVRWAAPAEWADLPMMPYVRSLLEARASEWLA